jgi:hypothetical protein
MAEADQAPRRPLAQMGHSPSSSAASSGMAAASRASAWAAVAGRSAGWFVPRGGTGWSFRDGGAYVPAIAGQVGSLQ